MNDLERWRVVGACREFSREGFVAFLEYVYNWQVRLETESWLDLIFRPVKGERRGVVLGPPDVGKTLFFLAYCLWRLGLDHALQILLVSLSDERAEAMGTWIGDQMRDKERVRQVFPDLEPMKAKTRFEKWTPRKFNVEGHLVDCHTPNVMTKPINSRHLGHKHHIAVLDDLHGYLDTLTEHQTGKTVNKAILEFLSRLEPDGEGYAVGTAWRDTDFQHTMAVRGWPTWIGTLLPEKAGPVYVGGVHIGDRDLIEGHFRWPQHRIEDKIREMGKRAADLQLGVDATAASGANPIFVAEDVDDAMVPGCEWTHIVELENAEGKFLALDYRPKGAEVISIGVDPAGEGKDKWGIVALKQLGGATSVLFSIELEDWSLPEATKAVAEIHGCLSPDRWAVETNFGIYLVQNMKDPSVMGQWLKSKEHRAMVLGLEEIKVTKATKEPMIAELSLRLERGHFRMSSDPESGHVRLAGQMKSYRAGGHPGDLLSAASYAQEGLGGGFIPPGKNIPLGGTVGRTEFRGPIGRYG